MELKVITFNVGISQIENIDALLSLGCNEYASRSDFVRFAIDQALQSELTKYKEKTNFINWYQTYKTILDLQKEGIQSNYALERILAESNRAQKEVDRINRQKIVSWNLGQKESIFFSDGSSVQLSDRNVS